MATAFATVGLIFALSHISGAHFNPVITFAFLLRREFKWWRVPIYWIAQVLGTTIWNLVTVTGAILAGTLLYWHFGDVETPVPAFIDDKRAFGLETIFTLTLVFVVLNVAERARITGTNAALASFFS
jgi:glycerol uptake facilitator-like aquaporin